MPQNPLEEDHLDAIETDKYDLQDSPSESELLGADEDDADDYSDDSMELPPHPPVSKEIHNTLEETVGQLISSTGIEDPNSRNPGAVFGEYLGMARKTPVFKV
jgi:hypothetical protein